MSGRNGSVQVYPVPKMMLSTSEMEVPSSKKTVRCPLLLETWDMGGCNFIFGCLNASSPKYTLYLPRTTAWMGDSAMSSRLTAVSAAETEAPTVMTLW